MVNRTKRILVNDTMATLNHRTLWHDLLEWFDMEFHGGSFPSLAESCDKELKDATLIIRNGSYFGPLEISSEVPTISLLQDIFDSGPAKKMQEHVLASSTYIVFNSHFTESFYPVTEPEVGRRSRVIPLPVNLDIFEIGNPMGLQQNLSLPDGCVCWIGACREAASVKGYDIFMQIVRLNPDIPFVAVFKDPPPDYAPPNLRIYSQQTHEELAKIIGACRVGLCTSRMETQHLAGIEMGACGLPVVAPNVGTYWNRKDIPGQVCMEYDVESFVSALRAVRQETWDRKAVRNYWEGEFSKEVIKKQWEEVVKEVEEG